MRFLNLKKKLPSLRVGVLVIAAFALVGLMMMPEMGKNFGVGIARAQSVFFGDPYIDTGSSYSLMPPPEPEEEEEEEEEPEYEYYQDECDTDYRNDLQAQMADEE